MATLAVMGQGDGRTVGEVQAFVDRAVHREAFMKQLTAAIVKVRGFRSPQHIPALAPPVPP